ncbi:MAG: UPF0175 family protein [Candidatus Baldrarchaeia archaeon]
MTEVKIGFPVDLARLLKVRVDDLPRVIREIVAVELYREGYISLGKAAEIVGVSKWEMFEILARRKVSIRYGPKDLEKDLETLKKMLEGRK